MGYAKHIGRVGALAFALGVGMGLGAAPPVAFAEDSGDSSSTVSNSSPSSSSEGSSGAEQADSDVDVSAEDEPESTEAQDADAAPPDEPSEDSETVTAATDDEASSAPTATRHRPPRALRAAGPTANAAPTDVVVDAAPPEDEPDSVEVAGPAVAAPDPSQAQPPAPSPAAVPETLDTATVSMAPPEPESSSVTLRTVLSSLLGRDGAPGVPDASPAVWVLAAAARRQLGIADPDGAGSNAVTLNSLVSGPIAGAPVVNPPEASGVVTGYVLILSADPGALTFVVSGPDKGHVTVTPDGGLFSFTYTPTAAARHAAAATDADAGALSDGFVLTVSDGAGTATVAVPVAVLPANAVPTAKARVRRPSFDGDVHGRIVVRDSDRDTATFASSPTAKGGTVTIGENGRFTYTPTAEARHAAASAEATDADKLDTFDVTVSDGHGGLTTVTVTVRIKPGNDAPTATVRTRSSWFSAEVTGRVRAKDLESDALTYTTSPSAKGGTVTIDDLGRFTYNPTAQARHGAAAADAPRRDRVDTFDIVVSDDHGGTTKVTVAVTIKPANSAPTAPSVTDVFTNPNTGVVTGRVVAEDADGDVFGFGIASGARKGEVVLDDAAGTFTYAPTAEARAAASSRFARPRDKTDTFRVGVDDGHGGVTVLTVQVAIAPLGDANSAPTNGTFTASPPRVLTGRVTGAATATDPDRDVLTYTGSGVTAKGSVIVDADGSFTYTPTDAARHQATSDTASPADKQDTFTITQPTDSAAPLTYPSPWRYSRR
ncbi:MAG: Ig-like domain-containing protein [Mycobacterium sp.]|nr:Ig-like domain-containing protein [Mycobacterium sp.]